MKYAIHRTTKIGLEVFTVTVMTDSGVNIAYRTFLSHAAAWTFAQQQINKWSAEEKK